MAVFRYTAYADDVTPGASWSPHDDWAKHYTGPALNDRDTELEDYLTGLLFSTAVPWTPVVTQGGVVTMTNTSSTYMQVGKMVFFDTVLTSTGTGTVGTKITVSLPVAADTSLTQNSGLGDGFMKDASTAIRYDAQLRWETATTMTFRSIGFGGDPSYLGSNVFTVGLGAGGNGDIVSAHGFYTAATRV